MINNIIEVWYWSFLLAALIGVVVYFSFGFVKDLWAAFKEQRAGGQAPLSKEKMTEPYSKRMVIIHWLTLALLIVAWYLGDVLVDARVEKDATLIGYFAHALMGGAILLLTILRLTFRGVDGTPPPVGNSVMDIVARGGHHGLYVLLILLSITGFMTLLTSTVGMALVTNAAILLPAEYTGPSVIPHTVHEILVTVMMVVVLVHILGAIKHQFIMKDGLMRRMSLRRKGRRPA
ncbi:MAG: cytochrome b/b6 domain-containing protein [Gallionella sp.]|nr:cytochrome b/b6 domain-containing protein [Gallionella sp.]